MPQNGMVADRHAETFHQPFGRPTTSAVAEKMNKFCGPLGPTSARTNNLRQLIRKRPALTLSVQTSPTAHSHLHHHGGALHGEILKMDGSIGCADVSTARGIGDRSLPHGPTAEITQRSPSRPTPRTRTSRALVQIAGGGKRPVLYC